MLPFIPPFFYACLSETRITIPFSMLKFSNMRPMRTGRGVSLSVFGRFPSHSPNLIVVPIGFSHFYKVGKLHVTWCLGLGGSLSCIFSFSSSCGLSRWLFPACAMGVCVCVCLTFQRLSLLLMSIHCSDGWITAHDPEANQLFHDG
ncbi:hypothetical protein BDBG_16689 [Blastomyces gilchristii SLH14081]|uniref:Uncharacterized protein n=1 Tax=Blastomyces gilchristii (strain SLH14081) TaxID=559298 RepID=A0A179UHN8_BLAGS|nr:uncharacterized protein BDBG_16689 [Blastomyces gilchristii SLH14081]OAT06749.1 hypothetical protein BDBG_16689 [Blastomyces gilchristii SLH14081]